MRACRAEKRGEWAGALSLLPPPITSIGMLMPTKRLGCLRPYVRVRSLGDRWESNANPSSPCRDRVTLDERRFTSIYTF